MDDEFDLTPPDDFYDDGPPLDYYDDGPPDDPGMGATISKEEFLARRAQREGGRVASTGKKQRRGRVSARDPEEMGLPTRAEIAASKTPEAIAARKAAAQQRFADRVAETTVEPVPHTDSGARVARVIATEEIPYATPASSGRVARIMDGVEKLATKRNIAIGAGIAIPTLLVANHIRGKVADAERSRYFDARDRLDAVKQQALNNVYSS